MKTFLLQSTKFSIVKWINIWLTSHIYKWKIKIHQKRSIDSARWQNRKRLRSHPCNYCKFDVTDWYKITQTHFCLFVNMNLFSLWLSNVHYHIHINSPVLVNSFLTKNLRLTASTEYNITIFTTDKIGDESSVLICYHHELTLREPSNQEVHFRASRNDRKKAVKML
jgi:hypothetical protein